jgi:hypothetical protein
MHVAARTLPPDRALIAMNDGILPVNGTAVFVYGIDKASDALARMGQLGGMHHRMMMMFEEFRSPQADVDVAPLPAVAACFSQLMLACQDPDKLLCVTLRAIEALEGHVHFRKESCVNQLRIVAGYFGSLPCVLLPWARSARLWSAPDALLLCHVRQVS